MKEFIFKVKMIFAIITHKSALLIVDEKDSAFQFTVGLTTEDAEELKLLDFIE